MRNIAIAALLSVLLTACGYDTFPDADPGDVRGTDLAPNADIALLRDSYLGDPLTIVENIVIEGYVTANDRSGNYFRTFVIEDVTGAAEINAGIADLHNYYQTGRRIVVKAKGLALGSYNDVLQIGLKVNPYSDYRVEDFGAYTVLGRYVFAGTEFDPVEPLEIKLEELDRRHCGKLVRLGRLLHEPEVDDTGYIADANPTWAFPGGGGMNPATGYRQFRDFRGDSLLVVTSGYANFASHPVSTDSLTLTGILIYGKFNGSRERFGLKLRDLGDVN